MYKPLQQRDNIKDKYNPEDLPIKFISYPRSGCHWFKIVLELLLKKPCWPEAYFYNTKPWGAHHHDINMSFFPYTHNGTFRLKNIQSLILLYRDPVDAIISNCLFEEQFDRKVNKYFIMNDANIFRMCLGYKKFLNRWFYGKDIKNAIYISYEMLKNSFILTISQILDFLNKQYTIEQIQKVQNYVTKNLVNKCVSSQTICLDNDNGYLNALKIIWRDKIRFCFQEEFPLFCRETPLIIDRDKFLKEGLTL